MPEVKFGENGEKSRHIDDAEFENGPQDETGEYDPDFSAKSPEEKLQAWREHLDRTVEGMSEEAIKQAEAGGPGGHAPAVQSNYVSLVEVSAGPEKKVVSREDFLKGPSDANHPRDPVFATKYPDDAAKHKQWEAFFKGGGIYAGFPPEAINEANARSSLHQDEESSEGASNRIGELLETEVLEKSGWSRKKGLGVGLSIATLVLIIAAAIATPLAVAANKQPPPPPPPPPPKPPDPPLNVKATVSGSDVTVSWEAAKSGAPATSYKVTLTSQTPVSGIPMLIYTAHGLPSGTYVATVVAVNAAGESGTAQSAQVKTPAAEGIDWTAVVDGQVADEAKKVFDTLTALPHDKFWPPVINIVATKGDQGKAMTYEDQIILARYLTLILTKPPKPTPVQINQFAYQIRITAVPPFPEKARAGGDPFIDPVPLWTAASKLDNTMGTALEPIRSQLFGLVRRLAYYLDLKWND